MNSIHLIKVENLVKKFGEFTAVKNISFDVKRSEIFGFLGANGAGKSTTIKILCGLLKASSGKVEVSGYDVTKNPEKVKQQIGYMSQKFSLYPDLTVDENLNFFGGIYGIDGKTLEKKKHYIKTILELETASKELAGTLPKGYQQRLAFACSIIHDPQIIFLDEPTSGIDPFQRRRLWKIIYGLAEQGKTIFVTTHFLDEAEFCHRICLISNGEIVAVNTPEKLKKSISHINFFDIECEPLPKAIKIMKQQKWVLQAYIFGSSMHAGVSATINVKDDIINLLKSFNISISRIEAIEPSLEDIFMHFIQEPCN